LKQEHWDSDVLEHLCNFIIFNVVGVLFHLKVDISDRRYDLNEHEEEQEVDRSADYKLQDKKSAQKPNLFVSFDIGQDEVEINYKF
jgi:predicted metallo-beta-lactamase superfamily hydrolase